MRTVLLINDTEEWYHFGCTATSMALKMCIKKAGYEVENVPITETYKIQNTPSTVEAFKDRSVFEAFRVMNAVIIDAIERRDILIINGEGTIHGIRSAPLNLLYLAYIAKVFLNKHVEILNHSVYPQDGMQLDNPLITALYRLVYSSIDFAAIRESKSYDLMKSLGLPVHQAFDCMPFLIREHIKTRTPLERNPKKILIAGSAAWLNLNIPSAEKGDIEKFEKELGGFISYLNKMSQDGYKIEFLYGAKNYPAKDDKEFIDFISPRLNFSLKVKFVETITNWMLAIEEAGLLVSGRFHHTIAAVCLGTPVIVLNSNTPKIEGVCEILFHSTDIIQYTDPAAYTKLVGRTESIMRGEVTSPRATLSDLCCMARHNFNSLLKLRTYSTAEEAEIESFFLEKITTTVMMAHITLDGPYLNEECVKIWKTSKKNLVKMLDDCDREVSAQFFCSVPKSDKEDYQIQGISSDENAVTFKVDSTPILHLDPDRPFINHLQFLIDNGFKVFASQLNMLRQTVIELIQKQLYEIPFQQSDADIAKLLFLTDIFDSLDHVILLKISSPGGGPSPDPADFGGDGGDQNTTGSNSMWIVGNQTQEEENI